MFIEEALKDLGSNYFELLNEIEATFNDFYQQPKQVILKKVLDKLERGKREHGELPAYTKEQLQKEIEDEFIDVLGWLLVARYLKT